MRSEEKFRAIEERWAAYFEPPLLGVAEMSDFGKRMSLAVFEGDQKVWEQRDNLTGPLLGDILESIAKQAKNHLRQR